MVSAEDTMQTTTALSSTNETADSTTTTTMVADSETPVKPGKIAQTARKEATTLLQDKMTTAKDEMKAKMVAAREEFKTKMVGIKDARKKAVATKIDGRINEINLKRTTQMTERLDRLTLILGKISTKEAALKTEGKTTTTLKADIAAAQTAIDAAKVAVDTQAAKDYVMTITTESVLKTSASTLVQQFMTDIKAVHAKVVAAQVAVAKAHGNGSKLTGTTPSPTITTTVTPVPTTTTP